MESGAFRFDAVSAAGARQLTVLLSLGVCVAVRYGLVSLVAQFEASLGEVREPEDRQCWVGGSSRVEAHSDE